MKKIINSIYRALYLFIFFLIFNLIYSLYFGRNTEIGFYSSTSCIEEYILDITSIGLFFSMMLAGFDVTENFINSLRIIVKKMQSEVNKLELKDYISKVELNDMPLTLDNKYMLNEISISEDSKIFAVKDTSVNIFYTEIEFNKHLEELIAS
ncbi:hypothetical protein RHK18_20190 [Clostridioides difficile]|nr:hypothetical protein [Clostridioides difficile]MDW0050360.1 hypothetical protein [Clostridioides difficile]